MKTIGIKPILGTGGQIGALIYHGINGKVARHARIFQGDGTTYFVVQFQDDTEFQVALDSSPVVRLSLLKDDCEGEQQEIAASERIPVPET